MIEGDGKAYMRVPWSVRRDVRCPEARSGERREEGEGLAGGEEERRRGERSG